MRSIFNWGGAYFTGVRDKSAHQDPGPEQGVAGRPQLIAPGPTMPTIFILQNPKTAHLASNLTLVTLGFSYLFFFFFSSISLSPRFGQLVKLLIG